MHLGINALFKAHGGSLANLNVLMTEWNRLGILLGHRLTLFCGKETLDASRSSLPESTRIELIERVDRGLVHRMWAEQIALPGLLREKGVDVLFCPANTLPINTSIPTVVTFQNAGPFCANMTLQRVGLSTWLRLRVLRWFIVISAKRATRIIFISRFFQKFMNQRFSVAESKSMLIYRARTKHISLRESDSIFEQYGMRHPSVICVSHLYPFKNILELIEAYLVVADNSPDKQQLTIVGGGLLSNYETKIRRFLRERCVDGKSVNMIGSIPSEHVKALLLSADVFAFPSTCENCPTSLIEAMSAGLPIVCSNMGVMPEIVGNAAVFFDPYDINDMAQWLSRVLSDGDLRREMSSRSLARAGEFPTPEEVALRTFSVIEDAAKWKKVG
jgi:glycosyltransferase involved in cell wall biosynthesis